MRAVRWNTVLMLCIGTVLKAVDMPQHLYGVRVMVVYTSTARRSSEMCFCTYKS